jgi:hypothetical protein
VDLHFGACFAKGIEVARLWYFGPEPVSPQVAIQIGIDAAVNEYGTFQCPASSYKTVSRLVGALRYYWEQWPLGADGLTPIADGIECRFDIALPIVHPDSGKPLRYAGRYDMLAENRNKRLYVVDEKTASRLGDKWGMKWDLDSQTTGYIWSVRHSLGEAQREVMAQIRAVSILKYDYGHAEVDVLRSTWMVERWYEQMLRDVRRMVHAYEVDEWDMALHENSCASFARPCEFSQLCCNPSPERIIADGVSYREEVWNPLTRL